MIERKEYLQKLIQWKDEQVIKVVTGMRRCGKSTLLMQYQDYLKSIGVEDDQIIAINFEDLGAKVPYEMSRDPAKNGGQDTLYTRQRKVFAPKGISYEKTSQTTLSPTDAELSDGANWALVHSGEATESQRSYINHKVIPIARIKSRG